MRNVLTLFKGRHQNSLSLTTNFSQNATEPIKVISYPVGHLCRRFTKLTGPCTCTLYSNPIPPTNGKNGLLCLVAYILQTGHQCFPACFCHSTVGKCDVSQYFNFPVRTMDTVWVYRPYSVNGRAGLQTRSIPAEQGQSQHRPQTLYVVWTRPHSPPEDHSLLQDSPRQNIVHEGNLCYLGSSQLASVKKNS